MENPESTSQRKADHIDLALKSVIQQADERFNYEPLLSAHPSHLLSPFSFLGKTMKAPIWVSSMTGGTKKAGHINRNLARLCAEFGFGMGLGSCRIILDDDRYFEDFNLRPIIGAEAPFYANLGIAQIEDLLAKRATDKIERLLDRLEADGLIVHVNPMQEWLQPEGDLLSRPPIETIEHLLAELNASVIIKEVGQGFGKDSLKKLLNLPIAAIDFGAFGGTNFAKLELLRANENDQELYEPLSYIGHTAETMVRDLNKILDESIQPPKCSEIIISGGVKNFLDGYYLVNLSQSHAVYGMAAGFLRHATGSYEELRDFAQSQIKGYRLAEAFLTIKA